MHPDREIRKDYAPEVISLELVGFAKQRVERLAQPLPVGRQSAHSKRRHILKKPIRFFINYITLEINSHC